MLTREVSLPFPVNLRHAVGVVKTARLGGRDLPGGVWWPVRTPDGPATLHLAVRDGSVDASSWGAGAGWAMDQVPEMLGSRDQPAGFRPRHPAIAELHRRFHGMRMGRTDRFFEALVPTIIAQQVTGKAAGRSFHALIRKYGEPAPGPARLFLVPSPEVVASLPYYDFHPLNISQRRAGTLIGVARRAARLEQIGGMPRDEAYRLLTSFPGVGPWTAATVMAEAAGDPDAVPVGDYHLPNMVSWALAGEARGDDERMLELLEPYRGHRGRVIRMLKLSGAHAPAFGPRLAVREFQDQ